MFLQPQTRDEIVSHAISALEARGEPLVHQEGPDSGKPLARREIREKVRQFILEQKQRGALIERRPYVESTSLKRGTQFVFVPQTLDLFAGLQD